MDEKALQDAYNLFASQGYKGDIEAFKTLMATNKNALNDAYNLFASKGYKGDVDKFSTLIGVKKKVPTDTPSTSGSGTSQSGSQKDGDLVSKGFHPDLAKVSEEEKPVKQTPAEVSPTEPVGFEAIPEQIVDESIADLYDQYKEAGLITSQQEKAIDTELKRQKEGDRGWWETLNAQVEGLFKVGMAIPLYQFDTKEDLIQARAAKNRIDFLESLPQDKVKELNAYAVRGVKELNQETRNILAENLILEEKSKSLVNTLRHVETAIETAQRQGKEIAPEGIEHYKGLINEIKDIAVTYNKNVDLIEADGTEIGSFLQELDFLKKNYGGLEYYQDLMRISGANIISGMSEFGSTVLKMRGTTDPTVLAPAYEWEAFGKEFREEVTRQQGFLKPAMSVTEIEGMSDFGKWLTEQTATQLPIVATLAVGGSTAGLAALGTSAAGQKIGEMRDIGDYTETQMFLTGVGYGLMEVASERVSLGILSKGKRAFKALKTPDLKKSFRVGLKDFIYDKTKDALSEGGAEFVNQTTQNLIDILYLGDEKVHVLDGTADALASGTAMGFGMSVIPTVIGMGARAFTPVNSGEKIMTAIAKANQLLTEVELKGDGLTDSTKETMLKKASKLIKEANGEVQKAYDTAKDLDIKQIERLISIDKQANKVLNGVKSVNDSDLSIEVKADLIKDFQNQVERLRDEKNKILGDAKKTDELREEGKPKEAEKPSVGDMRQDDKAKTPQEEKTQVEQETEKPKEDNGRKQAEKPPIKEGKPSPKPEKKTDKGTTKDVPKTQEVKRKKAPERIQPEPKKGTEKPRKLNEMIGDFSKKLGATLVYGKTRRATTAGTYSSSNALARIRKAGDLDTVAHEMGHLLDDRMDVVGSATDAVIQDQIDWYSDRGGSNPPSGASKAYKKQYLKREGVAEFLRAYIANPTEAKLQSPELFKHFESIVDPKTLQAIKDFSKDYLDFANAPAGDRMLSNVETSLLPEKKGFRKWVKEKFRKEDTDRLTITPMDKFKMKITNSMEIGNKAFRFIQGVKGDKKLMPEENFEIMVKLFAGINGKINNFFSQGLRDPRNKFMKDSKGEKMTINYLFEGLKADGKDALQQDIEDVIKLLIAERTVEYFEKFGRVTDLTGIGGGLKNDLTVADEHLADFEELKTTDKAKYDRIKEGARRYREFADAGLRYALESGRISQEQYDTIKENNRYYVSLARTKEVEPGEEVFNSFNTSSSLGSVKDIYKKAKGGTDIIKNPFMSLLANTVNIIKESDRNNVLATFIDPLTSARGMADGKPIDLSQIARPAKAGEKNTIRIFKEGKEQYWQFDQDILYHSIKAIGEMGDNNVFTTLMKPLADLIRTTVTTFPVFAARNLVRDTQSRLILSRTRGNVFDLLHNKEDRDLFEAYGGSQAGFYLTNENAYKEALNDAIYKLTRKGNVIIDPRNLSPKRFLRRLKKIGEKAENVNRIAEFNSAYKKAKKAGLDDYNAGLYAAYQARDLMDFAVAGTWVREINKVIPFSNAAVQSVKRSAKGFKENPAQFMARMAVFSVLPQALIRVLVSSMGDDEEYEELPDYQRDLFYNFKVPGYSDWISIPKPFELGVVSSIMDRGYSYTQGNKKAFEGATMSTIRTLFPFDEGALMGSFKPILEVAVGKDIFRDRQIIPYWEKGLDLKYREGTKYASRVGQALSSAFGLVGAGVDPRYIDHLIKGYTTYYGNYGLALFDIGKEDSSNQFDFTKTGFVRGMPISQAKSVQRAFKLAESLGMSNSGDIKVLKGANKMWYDLDDPKAKSKMGKEIYNYAKQLVKELEQVKKEKDKQLKISK